VQERAEHSEPQTQPHCSGLEAINRQCPKFKLYISQQVREGREEQHWARWAHAGTSLHGRAIHQQARYPAGIHQANAIGCQPALGVPVLKQNLFRQGRHRLPLIASPLCSPLNLLYVPLRLTTSTLKNTAALASEQCAWFCCPGLAVSNSFSYEAMQVTSISLPSKR
jgi:hypothetical protein